MREKTIKIFAISIISLLIGCTDKDETEPIITSTLSNGLIAKILLDNNTSDSTGNLTDGEIFGILNPTENRNGIENKAMIFSEDEGHIDFGNVENLELDYDSSISISVWIKPNGNQLDWDTILNQYFTGPQPSADGRFYLGLNPSNGKIRWNVFNNILESSNSVPIDEWTHIIVSYENRMTSIYINGILDTTLQLSSESAALGTGAPFKIGKQSLTSSNLSGFNGAIDDIYIYNRLLEKEEVQQLFQE